MILVEKNFSENLSFVFYIKLYIIKMDLLKQIVENKRQEIKVSATAQPSELIREGLENSTRDFRAALLNGRNSRPKLIAEIKRKSPSKNSIRLDLNVTEIVKIYEKHTAAISVLTDQKFFGGSLEDLSTANQTSLVPLLRKDFILDEYQLLEARLFGADAVLLIARILEVEELTQLILSAQKIGLDALVEIHSEEELDKVLQTPAEIIGINNRNLDTLKIDLNTSLMLAPKIPRDKVIVAESGITSAAEIEKFTGVVDGVLIGTGILGAENIEEKLVELT
jgi:indole-3-glycerol phosphate synthase